MKILNTWWKYALGMAAWTVVANLILRAIFWSDEALFSWNVPLSMLVGFLVGLMLWPMQHATLRRMDALKALSIETEKIIAEIDDMIASNKARNEAEALRLIEDLLSHPETGIHLKRKEQ